MEGMLTAGQASLKAGITQDSLRKLVRLNLIPSETVGHVRLFRTSDIETIRAAARQRGLYTEERSFGVPLAGSTGPVC